MQRPWGVMPTVVPHSLLSLVSYSIQSHPTSIISQETLYKLAYMPVWWGYFLNWCSLFWMTVFCQVDINLCSWVSIFPYSSFSYLGIFDILIILFRSFLVNVGWVLNAFCPWMSISSSGFGKCSAIIPLHRFSVFSFYLSSACAVDLLIVFWTSLTGWPCILSPRPHCFSLTVSFIPDTLLWSCFPVCFYFNHWVCPFQHFTVFPIENVLSNAVDVFISVAIFSSIPWRFICC